VILKGRRKLYLGEGKNKMKGEKKTIKEEIRKSLRIVEKKNGFLIYFGNKIVAWAYKELTSDDIDKNSYWVKEKLLLRGVHEGGGYQSPITFEEFIIGWVRNWMKGTSLFDKEKDRREYDWKEIERVNR